MKEVDLTKGKITKVLLALAIPLMGSSLLQFTYNLIDMIWVGKLGSDAVASIGSASFYLNLGYAINSLVVVGVGIKVSHALGKKNHNEAREYINSSLILNGIIAVIYAAILILFGKTLINFLGINDANIGRQSYIYLAISAPMLFFNFYNSIYTRIYSSYGNNKYALKISAIGILLNIILDPIFIYIFKLEVFGAAVATLISNIVMFLIFVSFSNGLFKIKIVGYTNYKQIAEIVRLGFPMSFQRVLFTFINILLAKIVAKFGADAIAAQKIGLQIESISFMVIGGLNGAIASFIGQNFGAKENKRIKDGYKISIYIGIIYSMISAIVFLNFSEELAKIFVKEINTIEIVKGYLQIIAFAQIFSAIEMISNGFFTGIGRPKIPATISIVYTVLRIPMALIFIEFFGLKGVWISIAISSVFKGITALFMYYIEIRKVDAYEK